MNTRIVIAALVAILAVNTAVVPAASKDCDVFGRPIECSFIEGPDAHKAIIIEITVGDLRFPSDSPVGEFITSSWTWLTERQAAVVTDKDSLALRKDFARRVGLFITQYTRDDITPRAWFGMVVDAIYNPTWRIGIRPNFVKGDIR